MAKQEMKQWSGDWKLANETSPTPKHRGTAVVSARDKEAAKRALAAAGALAVFHSSDKLFADRIKVEHVHEITSKGAVA